MNKKLNIVLLSAVLLFGAITGCSGTGAKSSEPSTTATPEAKPVDEKASQSKIDMSKKVELSVYMVGDAPKDLALIESELNKLTEVDLNATVKFNFTTWTDYIQKYKLLLSSGQPIDLIYTAGWLNYQSYAVKGAFLPLDELLPKAAPILNGFVPKETWDAVRINESIYTVPSTWKEYVTDGIGYREDLRKKYNLPIPESLETLEQYLDGIKKNEPDMIPLADSNSRHVTDVRHLNSQMINAAGAPPYGIHITNDNKAQVTSYWGSPQHLEDLKMYKRWMDKGFWSKNVLNIKDTANGLLQNGKSALIITGNNPAKYNADVMKVKSTHPDWELSYVPYPMIKGFSQPVHPIQNGMAIPRSSKNPERALAFYEKLVTDKRYNWLTQYGIEGKHFEVKDGNYHMIGDAKSTTFGREAMGSWAWRNPEFMLYDESFKDVLKMFDELEKISTMDVFTGFAEDWTDYQAEKAALEQVEKQYLYPLNVGLVDDVEAGLQTFMEKAKQAGLEKIQAEYTKQWLHYLEKSGIK